MFTGIIETTGKIRHVTGGQIVVQAPEMIAELKMGSSIAVNGICLTVVELTDDTFTIDFMPETAAKTSIGGLTAGDEVNLELAMLPTDRFEGHMVSGHVDGLGEVTAVETDGNAERITLEVPADLPKYIVQKGSITLDGISLTVSKVEGRNVQVSVIPHTKAETNLKNVRVGRKLNVEVDLMAKHLEKLLEKQ